MQQFHKLITGRLCFGCLHAHHQELTTALTASGFTLERGGSSVVGHGLRPRPTVCPSVCPYGITLLQLDGFA